MLNSDIADYLAKELYGKAIDLQTLAAELEGLGVGEERTKNVHSQAAIKKWFMSQYGVLESKFSGFLQLQH